MLITEDVSEVTRSKMDQIINIFIWIIYVPVKAYFPYSRFVPLKIRVNLFGTSTFANLTTFTNVRLKLVKKKKESWGTGNNK